MKDKQHQEDTKYKQWGDGMYVMTKDLLCDYEKALVEDSLRRSVYKDNNYNKAIAGNIRDCMGVFRLMSGAWLKNPSLRIPLTNEQAIYIATGDTDIYCDGGYLPAFNYGFLISST